MKLSWPPPNRTFGLIDTLGLAGVLGLLVARYIPVARLPFWGCVLRQQTGWPCLGCGLTRVADHVSHGDLDAAWGANPLGTVAALGFVVLAAVAFLHLAFKVPIPKVVLTPAEAWGLRIGLGLAVAVNWGFIIIKAKFPSLL